VLDNATTAQYTHTVTVTGRLGGQYVCTVSNDKPSQASANYTVKGNVRLFYYFCEFLLVPFLLLIKVVYPQLYLMQAS